MSKLQPARGTRDIYGNDARNMTAVVDTFRRVAGTYGFEELATPIFEFTEVYKRPLGEASDIVSKEMYTFEDRGGDELTLRPEFTAGVCRAFISNGMQQNLPCRLMSYGPAFRYERPQKGRYRQFHQVNAELLGQDSPEADIDMIAMAWRLLKELGLGDKVVLHLNTLGDKESRTAYREALVAYLSKFKDQLSEDSQRRLESNPLRILDSKNEGDKAIVADAPKLSDHLNEVSQTFFETVKKGLDVVGVPYIHDERLVRGMDYYCHTAFEFVTTELGAQGTVLGGGRYDGLIEQLGGPATSGVGWAGGIERLAMLSEAGEGPARPVVIMPMGEAATLKAFEVAETLRTEGFTVTADRSGNLKKRMNRADKASAAFAVIIGDNELERGVATLKRLENGEQSEIAFADIVSAINEK
ncbi:histidine--tRNA ligase [Kordiimonas sp. SCSIO 12610]|uniref:histidine--tRNA ligase n=1 Tax=Kordiimonas sp. SCSIO 12610 TaxID=2829597 RepID=UPI0021088080|nr:histidine--tRNA ligase [Kordiimonas sp. SCSIO 12610]UTW55745.1 histidine--tRNA ligase [Kordiimonas sp. SCSIO 12610]